MGSGVTTGRKASLIPQCVCSSSANRARRLAGFCEDGVLARLIQHDRGHDAWTVRHGPFAEDDFPALPDHDWTLLVQDVDKWDADIRGLLDAFAFLPRWRIDDVMVSFAARGGSVGAHVDQYDVFLVQAQGHRRWQVDATGAPPLDFRDDVAQAAARVHAPATKGAGPATCCNCRPRPPSRRGRGRRA